MAGKGKKRPSKQEKNPKRPAPQPIPASSSSEGDADLEEMRAIMARMEAKKKARTLRRAGTRGGDEVRGLPHLRHGFLRGQAEAPVLFPPGGRLHELPPPPPQ